MFNWYTVMVEMQRRQDEAAKADQYRYERQFLEHKPEFLKRRYQLLLAYLGRQMVALGYRLQTRYDLALAAPLSQEQHLSKNHVDPYSC